MGSTQFIRKYKNLFWAAWILFFVISIFSFSSQRMLIFIGGQDFGADYFNTNRYVADFDPYGNTINGSYNHNYLPINYVFQYILSLTADYANMTLSDCWHDLWGCLIPFAIYTLICACVFVYSLFLIARRFNVNHNWILLLIMSSIMIYTLERGNAILLAVTFINLFIAYFDSHIKSKRYLAIISLACASVMKVVPGILCILYLKRRDYKGLCYYGIIAALLTFLPFFCFPGGLNYISVLLENMSGQVSNYASLFSPYRFGLTEIATQINSIVPSSFWAISATVLNYILFFTSIYLACTAKNINSTIFYLMFIPAIWPGSAFAYNELYLFPLFLYTVGGNFDTRKSIIILTFYFFILQPVQIVWHGITLSYILANLCSVALWIYFVIDGLFNNLQSYESNLVEN